MVLNRIIGLVSTLYARLFAHAGEGTFISFSAELRGRNIKIGNHCRVLKNSKLDTSSNPSKPDYKKFTGSGKIEIGNGVTIKDYAFLISYDGFIRVGNDCTINPFTIIYGHGGVTIGNNVLVASHCVIVSSNHGFESIDVPISEQGLSTKGIEIMDDVWIGSNVKILDGVRVGKGCVVAAGSVVTANLDEFGVYGGTPARLLKKRA